MDNRRTQGQSPYQLIFFHGVEAPAQAPPGARVIPILTSSADPDAVTAALSAANLSAADTKTTAIFVSRGDILSAVVAYATLTGFVGRFLDISAGQRVEQISALVAATRRTARASDSRRETALRLDHLFVSPAPDSTHPTIVFNPEDPLSAFDSDAATALRFARRVAFVPPAETHAALRLLAALAGMRSTTRISDRFPDLALPSALPLTDASSELVSDMEVVELEKARRAGQVLRNQLSLPSADQLVDPKPLSSQRKTLIDARTAPMEPVLAMLGSELSADGAFYRCPRPQNHANGDANPSMRINENKVRCFVCDPEWVDPLSLVLSARGLAPIEAARLILSAV